MASHFTPSHGYGLLTSKLTLMLVFKISLAVLKAASKLTTFTDTGVKCA